MSKKKKILFYSHQANLAGAPLSLAALASNLSPGYEALFVTPSAGPVIGKAKCKTRVLGRWFQTLRLARIILRDRIDLVHANTVFATPAVYAAKLTNTKLVWHIREDLSMFPKKLAGEVQRLADRVIIISDSMRCHFPGSKKVIRIYNGLTVPKLSGKAARTPVIMYAGTIEKRKGVIELLKAVNEVKNNWSGKFLVELFGQALSVSKQYHKSLLSFVKEHDLARLVAFKGVTGRMDKALAKAAIVAVPSLQEPFGRVAVEAMAYSKPVVASSCGGLAEIVVDKRTGLLSAPGDHQSLARNLLRLLQDPKLRKAMGKKGALRYKKYFTLKKYVAEVEKVYRQLLK